MNKQFSDFEKQQLLTILYVHKICAPGLDRLVLRIAESISSEAERSSALLMASYYLASCGSLPLADEVAHGKLQGHASAAALASIGGLIADTNPDQAARYLEEAEQFLSQTDNIDDQAILLQRISQGYLRLRNSTRAREFANKILPNGDRVSVLCEIAGSLFKSGEADEAKQTLREARTVIDRAERSELASALNDIANVLVQIDRADEALSTWEEALKFVEESLDPPKLVLIICKGLASIGQLGRAREVALSIQNVARRAQALALIDGQ